MAVLITGGAGYIGSHTAVELLNAGYDVAIIDNLDNSSEKAIARIREITGKDLRFYKADVRDYSVLEKIFTENKIDAVIHFAGLKAVGESSQIPLEYYANNIDSTIVLCNVMRSHGCKNFVFSSSATVYGDKNPVPFNETMPTSATNPYGRTKLFIEHILTDLYNSDNEWSVALLRYFNPIGAHESGLIGEDPNGIPNNLMPYIAQVAVGKREMLSVFGDDYETPDGTGVRDYIHVVDLALGHVKAVKYVLEHKGVEAVNLGTGKGTSVLELKDAFQKASGKEIPFKIVGRRKGDVAYCYAEAEKAKKLFGWTAQKTIEDMCKDTWRWQKNNPNGFGD